MDQIRMDRTLRGGFILESLKGDFKVSSFVRGSNFVICIMFKNIPVRHSMQWGNQDLTLETGLLAQQATASVLATLGETTVFVAVVVNSQPVNMDYFPLQVIYEERMYASGKIKGSRFIKREGRPSEAAILAGRMIDRSLRSLFDPNIRNEIQVVITPLSIDEINPPDTLAVLAASAAIKLCGIEDYQGPVSSVRIGLLPQDRVDEIIALIQHKIKNGQSFEEMKNELEEFCQLVDVKDPDEKEDFGQVFQMLGKTDAEWGAKLKLLYQSTTRLSQKEIQDKYPNVKFTQIANPSYKEQRESVIDLVVSGDGHNIMMVEAGANIVDEETLGDCLDKASQELKKLNEFQAEFIQKATEFGFAKETKLTLVGANQKTIDYWLSFTSELEEVLYSGGQKLERADLVQEIKDKHFTVLNSIIDFSTKYQDLDELKTTYLAQVEGDSKIIANKLFEILENVQDLKNLSKELGEALEIVKKKIIKKNILEKERRLDGRPLNQTRKIDCQIDVLPRVHGSSLFQRGETQVVNILTLGSKRDAQTIDEMEDFEETTKRYIHHYNFPQYSVGATGRYNGPGRREIGHGALAERALIPVLPSVEEFPYTMRLVSECMGSNGSTSMASTCGSCLSLMAGGVPIKDMVAGVAMGLVLDSKTGKFKVLTDIIGAEDFNGDMDFKVTGTKDGITALQLDNKVAGLTVEILKQALSEAKIARMYILDIMKNAISQPAKELSAYAPRLVQFTIPVDKIGDVIGPGGKIIKALVAKTGTDIEIEDITGNVLVFGKDAKQVVAAADYIKKLTKDYVLGDVVEGKVFRIEAYGAFVKIDDTDREGLIHISQIAEERIKEVKDVIKMGQIVKAKVVEVNEKGQISLSMKMVK